MSESLFSRAVTFQGDELVAVQREDGTIYALFARLCDNLGLNQQAQARRVQRHSVLREGLTALTVATEGGPQTAQFLRLDLLPLWLSGVQAERVRQEVREKLVRYQRDAAQVLWQAFRQQILVEHPPAVVDSAALAQLQQIAEMGRAITAMAEQQMDLQRQQQVLGTRLDRAGQVVRGIQQHMGAIEVRLGVLEDRVHPAALISEPQANEVSLRVKALAELLTTMDTGKVHYQTIFAELYRRFGVSSYKIIRQEQYVSVLAFLESWRVAATTGRDTEAPGA
jgi:P22_AR N-terminal domain/ORF6C domain